MSSKLAIRPDSTEYGDYYARYVDLVPDGDVLKTLERQIGETSRLLGSLDEEKGEHRYAPGKWSIKEVVGHLIDSASNNHQRMVRLQIEDQLVFPDY